MWLALMIILIVLVIGLLEKWLTYITVSFTPVFLEFYNFEVFILFVEEIQRSQLCMLL